MTAGYVQFGSFLAILLLEATFLFVFFFRKSTDLHNRKQQLSKTDCRLCYWIRVLCDTLGGIGVVAAVQMASVYLFYIEIEFDSITNICYCVGFQLGSLHSCKHCVFSTATGDGQLLL